MLKGVAWAEGANGEGVGEAINTRKKGRKISPPPTPFYPCPPSSSGSFYTFYAG